MSAFFRMVSGCVMCLLVGCMSNADFDAMRVCKASCQQRLNVCNNACFNSCARCSARANSGAALRYNEYKQEQCLQGKEVVRELKSYRDPLQCRKTTCECSVDYRACAQSCSGKIPKRLEKSPAC